MEKEAWGAAGGGGESKFGRGVGITMIAVRNIDIMLRAPASLS